MKQWSLSHSVSVGEETREEKYFVTCWSTTRWKYFKSNLFHIIFCKILFGSWKGWTWLGNLKWLPDQFKIAGDEDWRWRTRLKKGHRMPLYTFADLNCPVNLQTIRDRETSVEVSKEQYDQLVVGGESRESRRERLQLKREQKPTIKKVHFNDH